MANQKDPAPLPSRQMKDAMKGVEFLRHHTKECKERVHWMKTDPTWPTRNQLNNEYMLSQHDTAIRVSERNAELARDLKALPKRPWNDKYITAVEDHASCQEALGVEYGKELLARAKRRA